MGPPQSEVSNAGIFDMLSVIDYSPTAFDQGTGKNKLDQNLSIPGSNHTINTRRRPPVSNSATQLADHTQQSGAEMQQISRRVSGCGSPPDDHENSAMIPSLASPVAYSVNNNLFKSAQVRLFDHEGLEQNSKSLENNTL